MPTKFCLFCGEYPEEKTKEHVLPLWLLELTGDPKRVVTLGVDLTTAPDELKSRQFAFSQFHFPACRVCNERFGVLEEIAKPIVMRLLAREAVGAKDLSLLLDWLDKVRLGLWLGFHQLDKNVEGIRPRFHVRQRIGRKDRMVILVYGTQEQEHLSFIGPSTLAFRWLPSVFGLIINKLFVLNVSAEYILARRLGFPYPRRLAVSLGPSQPDYVELGEGLARVLRPVFTAPLQLTGACYYQPMFPLEMQHPTRTLYENDYAASHSLDWEAGVGGVYCTKGDRFGWLENGREPWWLPDEELHRVDALKKLGLSVVSILRHFVQNPMVTFGHRSTEDQDMVRMRVQVSLKELSTLLKEIRKWPESRNLRESRLP